MPEETERRKRVLSDADILALKEAVHGGLTPEEHLEHHLALRTWIERENKKAERAEKIKTQLGGWAIITVLGGTGKLVYEAFLYLREHLR